jgi:hypothetical protein
VTSSRTGVAVSRSGNESPSVVPQGLYRTKDNWPDELAIAPEAGFTLHEGSWCGTCARYSAVGRILAVEGADLKLAIDLEEPWNPSSSQYHLDDTLHLVRWGDLLFAVPEQGMESFCAEASDGTTFPGVPFRVIGEVRDFDFQNVSRPKGMPNVPSSFQHLLLDRPISCSILTIVEWKRRPELDGEELRAYDVVYSVDAGSADGLAPGMRLFVDGGSSGVEFRGRVEQVDVNEGRFRLLVFEDRKGWAEGLPGTRATTFYSKPRTR